MKKVTMRRFLAFAVALMLLAGENLSIGVYAADDGVTCGDFTVYGDTANFSFDSDTGVLTILGGDVRVRGTGTETKNTIVVKKDVSANITLEDVNINVSSSTYARAFKIEDDSTGNIAVILEGNNTLKSGAGGAGLQKNGNDAGIGSLEIKGAGTLTAVGGQGGAGIGGGNLGSGSNITISGGNVTATGGLYGAGIGGGDSGSGSDITISGGDVTATGGDYGAGIGGGYSGSGSGIIISGGNVTATGGMHGTGIGGGYTGSGSDITISGGDVTATGGKYCAGIGGGYEGIGSDITISGGTVTATGGSGGAAIGGGESGSGSDITISDGTVTATGGYGGAAIGGGESGSGSDITISGGDVTATGGDYGAGIGGGYEGSGSEIIISGGNVTATGGSGGASIGGGNTGSGSDITISGGNVTATGGSGGAGIGGGYKGSGSGITISDSTVTATGGSTGAGIGGGYTGSGSDITISGGNVTATGGNYGAGIGGGARGSGSKIIIKAGSVKAKGNDDGTNIGGGKYGGGSVTPTNDGTTPVYLLEITNENNDIIAINGMIYPSSHGDENKIYAYLPAKTKDDPNIVSVGSEETKYYYTYKWLTIPSVTAPTAKEYLTFNNTEQELVNAGSSTGGVMVYSLEEDGIYSESIPTALDAGTYDVWYKVVDSVDRDTVLAASAKVEGVMISPAEIGEIAVTDIDAPVPTEELDTSATTSEAGCTAGVVSWTDSDTTAEYGKAYTIAIVVTATNNYSFSDSITATVNGETAYITKNEDGTATITYTFPDTPEKDDTKDEETTTETPDEEKETSGNDAIGNPENNESTGDSEAVEQAKDADIAYEQDVQDNQDNQDNQDASGDLDTDTVSPDTGDDSNPALWIILMFVSMTAATALYKKKKIHP